MAAGETSRYAAIVPFPIFSIGVVVDKALIREIQFLPVGAVLRPVSELGRLAWNAFVSYRDDARYLFHLPLAPAGTPFSCRVWQYMLSIPPGEVRSYGEAAKALASAPRAVGGAAKRNPFPIVIPCHRIVAASGAGGFMGQRYGHALDIKRWLLDHERRRT